MLLAAVGQTPLASYAQHTSTTTVTGTPSGKTKGTQNQQTLSSRNQQKFQSRSLLAVTNSNHNSFSRPTTVTAATATATSSLMKTLSVRLHRGTEYIKDTVQRALVVSSAANAGCSTSTIPNSSAKTLTTSQRGNLQRSPTLSLISAPRTAIPSASFINLYTVPPTRFHRSAKARQNAGSTDSLLKELCHFKPIRPMPLTPIKMSAKPPGCDIKCPKVVYATQRFASKFSCDDTQPESSFSNASVSPVVKEKPMSTTLLSTTPQHKSAFVCLITHMDLKHTPNTDDGAKTKKTKRRRRCVFSTPKHRARRNAVARKAITTNEIIIQNTDPTPIIESKSKPINRASEHPQADGKRKRKYVESLAPESQLLDAPPTIPLKTESQPSKKKRTRTRITKDCQVVAFNLQRGTKKISQRQKSFAKGTAKTVPPNKKIAVDSSQNISRGSPPMTRQRARQISYNQSK